MCSTKVEETQRKKPRGGEFMAVFNFVVGLLPCRRGIRLSLMLLRARDQIEIGCKTT